MCVCVCVCVWRMFIVRPASDVNAQLIPARQAPQQYTNIIESPETFEDVHTRVNPLTLSEHIQMHKALRHGRGGGVMVKAFDLGATVAGSNQL